MRNYQTVVEALNDLKQRGFTLDFNLANSGVQNKQKNLFLSPNDFEISEVYRFEGETDPADAAIIYAIESSKYHVKGVFVDGYGVYSNDVSEALLKKLRTHQ